MNKEQILEEFEKEFFGRGYHWSERYKIEVLKTGRHKCNKKCRQYFYTKPSRENILNFLSKALDKTQQATIEEIENLVEVEPALTIEGQKVVSLSWKRYLDLLDKLKKEK